MIPQGKAAKTKCLHHFVSRPEIPISGLWLQSQRTAEGNKWDVGGSPAYPSHQTDVASSTLLGQFISPAHPLLPPSRRCLGDVEMPISPENSPIVALSRIASGVSGSNCSAGQGKGRKRTRQELREAPGHRESFGLCRAAALSGDRWPELLLLFNVFPPWHCPDSEWGREPMPELCVLSIMEKNS